MCCPCKLLLTDLRQTLERVDTSDCNECDYGTETYINIDHSCWHYFVTQVGQVKWSVNPDPLLSPVFNERAEVEADSGFPSSVSIGSSKQEHNDLFKTLLYFLFRLIFFRSFGSWYRVGWGNGSPWKYDHENRWWGASQKSYWRQRGLVSTFRFGETLDHDTKNFYGSSSLST